jgi:hypothetical protein
MKTAKIGNRSLTPFPFNASAIGSLACGARYRARAETTYGRKTRKSFLAPVPLTKH